MVTSAASAEPALSEVDSLGAELWSMPEVIVEIAVSTAVAVAVATAAVAVAVMAVAVAAVGIGAVAEVAQGLPRS